MKILVTGGAGYLGSTICYALEDNGHTPIVLDMSKASGNEIQDRRFYQGDISDKKLIEHIFSQHGDIKIVIHCAERSAVSASVVKPYEFYSSNVVKSMELFKNLRDAGCKKIIFASSASIYDDVPGFMVTERSPVNPRSPFARTKFISEMILKDFCDAYGMKCIALRYFNPIGADPKSRCGFNGKSFKNIIGNLLRIFEGELSSFVISGNDWGTRDGTCMRDYVHIWDVALANVKAVENFDTAFEKTDDENKNFLVLNIGSGIGVTVMEFIFAFENITGEKIKIVYGDRRPGDIGGSYANALLAEKTIGWKAEHTVEDAIIDAIRWEETKDNALRK